MTKKILVLCIMFSLVSNFNVFAANPYNIIYEGGEPLGQNSNVKIDPEMISGLASLMSNGGSFNISDPEQWHIGYLKYGSGACAQASYFLVDKNTGYGESDKLAFKRTKGKYTIDVTFNNVYIENPENLVGGGEYVPVNVNRSNGNIFLTRDLFLDSQCTERVDNTAIPNHNTNSKVFIELNYQLSENGNKLSSDQLYAELNDIDASQSFKILNPDNVLNPDNMYATSIADLQPTNSAKRNMFVSNGNYIYSEPNFGTDKSHIYTRLTKKTQEEGLNIVLGYSSGAAALIGFYAKQYSVAYLSDSFGTITGATNETVLSGECPSGTTTTTSNPGYTFSHYVADKNVTLADGTVILSGDPITLSQLSKIAISENLILTAVHVSITPAPIPDRTPASDKLSPGNKLPTPDTGAKYLGTPNDGLSSNDTAITAVDTTIIIALVVLGGAISRLLLRK